MGEHQQNQGQRPVIDQSGKAVSPADLAEVLRRISALEGENQALRQEVALREDVFPTKNPVYEILDPGFYSKDDVYYPAGAQVEDLTGVMVPNECMVPLNAAARERSEAYIESLPQGKRTPNLDTIVETAMRMRPREGDDPAMMAQLQANMLTAALAAQYGVTGQGGRDTPRAPVKREGVPMMPNTRIVGHEHPGLATRASRLAMAPLPAALKTTRAMGTVQSNPLGTEQAGVGR